MPTYCFLNTQTDEIEYHVLKMADYDAFKSGNPHLERYHESAPTLSFTGTGDFGNKKPDDTWNEVLSKIAESHPGSELAKTHRRRTIKEIKTENILEKHRKRAPPK